MIMREEIFKINLVFRKRKSKGLAESNLLIFSKSIQIF